MISAEYAHAASDHEPRRIHQVAPKVRTPTHPCGPSLREGAPPIVERISPLFAASSLARSIIRRGTKATVMVDWLTSALPYRPRCHRRNESAGRMWSPLSNTLQLDER